MMTRPYYVGAVPVWLAQILAEMNAPTSTAASLNKVAELLSVDDACNYLHYLMKRCYVGSTFSDMSLLTDTPENVKWINEHSKELARTKPAFESAFNKASKDLESDKVPLMVRKVSATPYPVDSNVLLLVGSTSQVKNSTIQFLRNCLNCINTQLLFDEYKRCNVFKEYTKSV